MEPNLWYTRLFPELTRSRVENVFPRLRLTESSIPLILIVAVVSGRRRLRPSLLRPPEAAERGLGPGPRLGPGLCVAGPAASSARGGWLFFIVFFEERRW